MRRDMRRGAWQRRTYMGRTYVGGAPRRPRAAAGPGPGPDDWAYVRRAGYFCGSSSGPSEENFSRLITFSGGQVMFSGGHF